MDYIIKKKKTATFRHSFAFEVGWTILPSFVLISIMIPSLSLLYAIDDIPHPELTVKVTGHQWFWSYELSDENYKFPAYVDENRSFDSNLISTNLSDTNPRLYAVDNALYLPIFTNIRLLVTSDDVIHSWAIPAFGIKMDAVPGRLNQVIFQIWKEGIYFGQCSELCGAGHGFMPIKVVAYDPHKPFNI